MSIVSKTLQLLCLFEDSPRLNLSTITEVLEISPSTAYRHLASLEACGMVIRLPSRVYAPGAAMLALARAARLADPLVAAAEGILAELASRTGASALVSRVSADRLVCVHAVSGALGPLTTSKEVGRSLPLWRGACAKIVLAYLPDQQLQLLANQRAREIAAHGLPPDPAALRREMARLREARVCRTSGEVESGASALAVALRQGARTVGSLSMVFANEPQGPDIPALADQLLRAGRRLEGRLADLRRQQSI